MLSYYFFFYVSASIGPVFAYDIYIYIYTNIPSCRARLALSMLQNNL